ncbi:DNA-binding transcriptional regulator, AcrR family [Actinokineospora alba]|uniref:DNA-binding transcriptional regulator, AcrR family n=1 Tax=Actinokineospora alba TaxID=504798 RepID=A0A1H0TVQ3_9PSEU|nr:TetR/AcrR family transcriptional regulator [Actinokineospora alba]TDP70748.1 TetR family transcriptional regulator [Actinokineospora alba]SDJ15182.1 DNA-binding transcriptional regulator, AcrR family [Actinokineospora alba]SDP58137.1 DNA-binding transcriptional regulator, AcrR family [Actinokineospora alba]
MSESKRGRPRDMEVDRRVLDIAAAQLVERGYAGLSIDAVAEAAGVAKTTLYRRWPSKDHLAVAVTARMQEADPVADTGDIRVDLVNYLTHIVAAINRSRSLGLVAELAAAAARHDDIGELIHGVFTRRNALVLALIERAKQRGELRADTDAVVLFDQLAGALYYRVLFTGMPIDPAYAERLVTAALDGAVPTGEMS